MSADTIPGLSAVSPVGGQAGPTSADTQGEGVNAGEAPAGIWAGRGSPAFSMTAFGEPKPQGSKKAFVNRKTGRAMVVEDNKGTRPWRETVKFAALDALTTNYASPAGDSECLTDAIAVELVFTLARPGFHFGSGRNARVLRAAAPEHPSKKPDVDKLVRACFDSLRDAGVYRDDAQVYDVRAVKCYPGCHARSLRTPGVSIRIWRAS